MVYFGLLSRIDEAVDLVRSTVDYFGPDYGDAGHDACQGAGDEVPHVRSQVDTGGGGHLHGARVAGADAGPRGRPELRVLCVGCEGARADVVTNLPAVLCDVCFLREQRTF